MATIKQIIGGIQVRLKTIPNLRVPERVPDTVDPPAGVVEYRGTVYDSTMDRGSDDHRYVVRVLTSKASDRGQDLLYTFADGSGANSVRAAIAGDPDLNGLVMYAVVTEAGEPEAVTVGDVDFYSIEITIVVSVAG